MSPPDTCTARSDLPTSADLDRADVARNTAIVKDSEPSLTWVLGLRPKVFARTGAAQISGPSLPLRRDLQYPCRLLPWPAEVRVGAPFSRPRLAVKGCAGRGWECIGAASSLKVDNLTGQHLLPGVPLETRGYPAEYREGD